MKVEDIHISDNQPDGSVMIRYIRNTASEEEKARIDIWVKEDPEHEKTLLQIARVYYACQTQERIASRDALEAYQEVRNKIKSLQQEDVRFEKSRSINSRIIVKEILKIAAIVLIVIAGNHFFQKSKVKESPLLYQTLYVPAGQRAELILPDSTKVWLNAHSKLIYPVNFFSGTRQVDLEGEAYFEVQHNEEIPFIVKTRKMNIKVLGTEFNVSAYANSKIVNVNLLRGSIELNFLESSNVYRMVAGEQILYKDGRYTSSLIEDIDYFRWKEGLLCFNNQPISEIIDKLRLYYDVRIEVSDQPFLNEKYSGKFRVKDGIEQVLKVLQLEHKFTYVKDNELNLITIK